MDQFHPRGLRSAVEFSRLDGDPSRLELNWVSDIAIRLLQYEF